MFFARLVTLYVSIPKKVGCPGELKVNWMESHNHFEGEEFEGRAELIAFYAWQVFPELFCIVLSFLNASI